MLNRLLIGACLTAIAIMGWLALRYAWSRTHRVAPPMARSEATLTIIPGWNLRQVADYLVTKGFASTTADVYDITGQPAVARTRRAGPPTPDFTDMLDWVGRKEPTVSYEGYIAPETYRVFVDATLGDIFKKFLTQRNKELEDLFASNGTTTKPTVHDIVTMASIVEKETRHDEDRALVADILWRRFKKGWALQVDSSVHYVVDRTGDVFTTDQERAVDSPWNTYKYPGLPPGPICNPSTESLRSALYPTVNRYWYFLTGTDGIMRYATTLEEHNLNRARYLK